MNVNDLSLMISGAKNTAELQILLEIFIRLERVPCGSAAQLEAGFRSRFRELQETERMQFESALAAFVECSAEGRKVVPLRS